MFSKRDEFMAWLTEVKKKSLEHCTKWEEKDLEAEYREDYNTATMPHKKFYNLDVWERSAAGQKARRAAASSGQQVTDFNDESARAKDIQSVRDRQKEKEFQK